MFLPRSRRDHLPHRERDVLDAVVRFGPAAPAELAQARVRRVEADHALEFGDRDEQWAVGVALAQQGVDLQYRMGGITRVDARAVIDDPLEDRRCPEPHATMLADAGT
jgi:hypothetical protein